jgi:transposase
MPRTRKLRPLTDAERSELERLARSRSEELRLVERAKAILLVYAGQPIQDAAEQVRRHATTVSQWLTRFEQQGLDGLQDAPKSGRPPTYSETERGQLIATARTHPDTLGLPFGHWTLDRLRTYAHEHLQIPISRAQLARVLEAEGLRWYQEQTYFRERPDPQFAEKRGPLSPSTKSLLPTPT